MNITDILNKTAAITGISHNEILAKKGSKRPVVYARTMASAALKITNPDLWLKSIGTAFNRSPSHAYQHLSRHKMLMEFDAGYKFQFNLLISNQKTK